MRHAMKIAEIAGWCCVVLFTGCYTQFGSTLDHRDEGDRGTPSPSGRNDTAVTARIDTVRVRERENCYWSRDLLGYPVLKCDRSLYHRDWFVYHNSPWWYRNDAYWYDYDRCPRYYYYDPSCDCCRYYTERQCLTCPPTGGEKGSGGTGGSGSSSRGTVPDRGSRTSGRTRVTTETQTGSLEKSTESGAPASVEAAAQPTPTPGETSTTSPATAPEPDTGSSPEASGDAPEQETQRTPPSPPPRRSTRSR